MKINKRRHGGGHRDTATSMGPAEINPVRMVQRAYRQAIEDGLDPMKRPGPVRRLTAEEIAEMNRTHQKRR
jgi:hypothetical protein